MAESADDKAQQGTPVAYRAGIELTIMAPNGAGGVEYHLGKKDGLSKPYHWTKANEHLQYLSDADAQVMRDHQASGGLRSYPRTDFMSGEDTGVIDPEFLIGDDEIKKHKRDFTRRYGIYAAAARELAEAESVDVEQIPS